MRIRHGGRRAALVALALAAPALAACGGDGFFDKPPPPPPCPRVAAVDDAARLIRFAGEGRDLTDVTFEAEVDEMEGSCVYDDDTIEVELLVQFVASRGPANEDRRADFTYFVAIAKLDQTVIARREFDTYIEFPGNQVRAGIIEELEQRIPIRAGERGDNYVIYVGFKLTPAEVEFNRAQQ